jgi:hypothetical protein
MSASTIQPVPTSGRWTAGTIALSAVALLVILRAASELAMMGAFDSDPQIPIWMMFLVVKVAFWLLLGGALAALLFVWPKRKILLVGLLVVWGAAIGAASWQYFSARQSLVAASNPLTSPDRLRALVHFRGIQAGYELDNRIASNPNTPVEALRELYKRGQLGTLMCLAANPNTPPDLLEKLSSNQDEFVVKRLADNPKLPERIRERLGQTKR